jgi:multicomponent Na+:H+ antiporter subunit G
MEFIQELLSTLFIIAGVLFMMIAALGIIRLPDFYIRMSAITKAGTMGVGLIVVGIAIYFNELLIGTKAFVVISFMVLTAPVAAHIIARAAYKHGVPFWGNNLVDELGDLLRKRAKCQKIIAKEPGNLKVKFEILEYHTIIPPILGGNLKKAILVASEIKEIDAAEGHRALGMVHERDRDYELAETEYQSAVDVSGGQKRYRYLLGLFYQRAGKYEQAFEVFENIYRKDKREMRALYEIGKTSALSGTNLDRGEECLNFYMNIHPPPRKHSLSRACYHLGMIFLKRKEHIVASDYFEKALAYDPGFHDARYLLGRTRKK